MKKMTVNEMRNVSGGKVDLVVKKKYVSKKNKLGSGLTVDIHKALEDFADWLCSCKGFL